MARNSDKDNVWVVVLFIIMLFLSAIWYRHYENAMDACQAHGNTTGHCADILE